MRSIFAEERLTGSEKDEFLSATYEGKEQVRKRRVGRQKMRSIFAEEGAPSTHLHRHPHLL